MVEQRGLQNYVHLAGYIPNDKIHLWYNSADIFVLPTYYEGTPNVVIEAMACELPVIATNVGGIPEVIEDKRTGVLVKPKDVSGLEKEINLLMRDGGLRRALGETARKAVEKRFTWKRNVSILMSMYRDVVMKYVEEGSKSD